MLTEEQKNLIVKASERIRELDSVQNSVFEQLQVDLGIPELEDADEAIEWLHDIVYNGTENYIYTCIARLEDVLKDKCKN